MPFRAYCRIPTRKSKHILGSNPDLYNDVISELRGAETINLSICLFTNSHLKDFLVRESENGCDVNIISLPLLGYKDKKTTTPGYNVKISARELAKANYDAMLNNPRISLYMFPHMYYWYGASYSGGNPSYSLHTKICHAKFGETKKSLIFSGNLSTGDPIHSENLIVIENLPRYNIAFERFFNDLLSHSIDYQSYTGTNEIDPIRDFNFIGNTNPVDVPQNVFSDAFFTAPFYSVGGIPSNYYASRKIIENILNANNRIWICAQHVHDLGSYDPSARTIFGAIKQVKDTNGSINIKMLKQLTHKGLADKSRSAIAECFFKFYLESPQRVNKMVHDKFIIVDNKLIVSTANYTPTQFAFGQRDMEFQIKSGNSTIKHTKRDIFSEVNGFTILDDEDIVNMYVTHFENLWNSGTDIQIDI